MAGVSEAIRLDSVPRAITGGGFHFPLYACTQPWDNSGPSAPPQAAGLPNGTLKPSAERRSPRIGWHRRGNQPLSPALEEAVAMETPMTASFDRVGTDERPELSAFPCSAPCSPRLRTPSGPNSEREDCCRLTPLSQAAVAMTKSASGESSVGTEGSWGVGGISAGHKRDEIA
ncbi:hypothetical protein AAFF_G00371540 [Aldrovandia affinis]|uniref:Uncharacterized protein n=1 Tax=Aldrovandia affinis TaxID=143900 RepID=A0AAD7SGS8_9TELE|nr:hypothetical protein AAFF_G00371540 [Aldrovandia affinis]